MPDPGYRCASSPDVPEGQTEEAGLPRSFESFIFYGPAKAGNEDIMIHLVEEGLQIHLHHPLLSFLLMPEGMAQCIMGTATGPRLFPVGLNVVGFG